MPADENRLAAAVKGKGSIRATGLRAHQRLVAEGAAGDGELAGVEAFVPDGELEDGGEVGEEFWSAVGSFLGQVFV